MATKKTRRVDILALNIAHANGVTVTDEDLDGLTDDDFDPMDGMSLDEIEALAEYEAGLMASRRGLSVEAWS